MKQLILDVSATASGQCRLDGTERGADAEIINGNAQATFPGSSSFDIHSTTKKRLKQRLMFW